MLTDMEQTNKKSLSAESASKRRRQLVRLHRANNVFTIFIVLMAIGNVVYLVYKEKQWSEIAFRTVQYIAMLLIMQLPLMLKRKFKIEVPWILSIVLVLFSFSSLILGDGLDLYGRLPWWDKLLHAESGFLLSMIALWLIHILMAENDRYIYFNKYFLVLFLVMFSLGLGACWEIMEYTYDSLMGTNTQQFMLTTTSSLISAEDVPLCGHAALRDTMTDLIFDLAGALVVALYGFVRHDRLLEKYYTDAHITN